MIANVGSSWRGQVGGEDCGMGLASKELQNLAGVTTPAQTTHEQSYTVHTSIYPPHMHTGNRGKKIRAAHTHTPAQAVRAWHQTGQRRAGQVLQPPQPPPPLPQPAPAGGEQRQTGRMELGRPPAGNNMHKEGVVGGQDTGEAVSQGVCLGACAEDSASPCLM